MCASKVCLKPSPLDAFEAVQSFLFHAPRRSGLRPCHGRHLARARYWMPSLAGLARPRASRPAAGRWQLPAQPQGRCRSAVASAQPQDELATMLDEAACAAGELLHHRLDAPPLGLVAHRREPLQVGQAGHQPEVAGKLPDDTGVQARPVRAPHAPHIGRHPSRVRRCAREATKSLIDSRCCILHRPVRCGAVRCAAAALAPGVANRPALHPPRVVAAQIGTNTVVLFKF